MGRQQLLTPLAGEGSPNSLHFPALTVLEEKSPDPSLSCEGDLDLYLAHVFLPWRIGAGRLVVAAADSGAQSAARAHYGADIALIFIPRRELVNAIEQRFRSMLLERSVFALKNARPEFSAQRTFTVMQLAVLASIPLAFIIAFYAIPTAANAALAGLFVVGYLANAAFRATLVWIGAQKPSQSESAHVLPAKPDADLPLYSILVPLYREANVMPSLAAALCRLAYPRDRLDIKLILEADDCDTIAAARAFESDSRFEIICVPPGGPRTKPRACNYALPFVRGEFTVIFDAEDRPEPDQLLKAVAAFRNAPAELACLQARLNFYNASENWLTRLFALDYALWFDYLLPGLDRLGVPMPLGGTSNHFRTEALRAIHGWDPFNVTEDADIGIRLAQLGYRVTTLDSTTFEEATTELDNWLRQRSRWLKGYMQTWLVHMRSPRRLLRNAGLKGFLGFQLFIGGAVLTALLNPLLWALSLLSLIPGADRVLGEVLPQSSMFGMIAGNSLFIYLAMLGPYRRGWLGLSPYGLAAPLYWLMISAAAYRGLWQLITNPWHWEKTRHGTTKMGAL